MEIRDLTLDQLYDLEASGSFSVGSRSAVFLEANERAGRAAQTPKCGDAAIFNVGDGVRVRVNDRRKNQKRFISGVVIQRAGAGKGERITVRTVSSSGTETHSFRVHSISSEVFKVDAKGGFTSVSILARKTAGTRGRTAAKATR